jgi:hypothetical protein
MGFPFAYDDGVACVSCFLAGEVAMLGEVPIGVYVYMFMSWISFIGQTSPADLAHDLVVKPVRQQIEQVQFPCKNLPVEQFRTRFLVPPKIEIKNLGHLFPDQTGSYEEIELKRTDSSKLTSFYLIGTKADGYLMILDAATCKAQQSPVRIGKTN